MKSMRVGDRAFFYHSSTARPGIVGEVEIVRGAYPDPTQFERGEYHDPKSTEAEPRWVSVDVRLVRRLDEVVMVFLRFHSWWVLHKEAESDACNIFAARITFQNSPRH